MKKIAEGWQVVAFGVDAGAVAFALMQTWRTGAVIMAPACAAEKVLRAFSRTVGAGVGTEEAASSILTRQDRGDRQLVRRTTCRLTVSRLAKGFVSQMSVVRKTSPGCGAVGVHVHLHLHLHFHLGMRTG
jgi:hypothetical protein